MLRRQWLKHSAAGLLLATTLPKNSDASQVKKRIKVGQIGVGHPHASKLSVYRASPDYEVVGIVEPDEALKKSAMAQPVYSDLKWMTRDELLNIKDLDAVLVETRVADLLNTAEVCITAGKHIHLDKPAGDNLTQYKRILDNAKKQNLLTQMGFMYRYNPAVVLLRDFLKKGWLGDIFEVHTVMSKVVSTPERKQLAKFKGGIMFELGCHITDLVIGVLGKPTKVEGFNQHASTIDDGLMDNMLAVLTYPKAIASVKTSAMEVEGGSRRHLVVCGSEGTFEIEPLDNPSVKLSLSKPRGEYKKGTQVIKFQGFNRYVADAADMVRIIRGEKPSDFSYDHDFAVQETLLQACKVL